MKLFPSLLLFLFLSSVAFGAITVDIPLNTVQMNNKSGTVSFEGALLNLKVGHPALPVHTCDVLLPLNADMNSISVSIVDGQEVEVQGTFTVAPATAPRSIEGDLWPEGRVFRNGQDVAIYGQDAIYPSVDAEVVDDGELYGFKIVSVSTPLYRYNPISGKLYRRTAGKISVDFNTSSDVRKLTVPREVLRRVQRHVVNYDEIVSSYLSHATITEGKKLAIMTTKATVQGAQQFQNFLDSKKKRGIDVKVITEDMWGGGTGETGAGNMRKWLQDNYMELALTDLLLIGNSSGDVPMMTFSGYTGQRANCPQDWCYAQLSGDYKSDKKCELHVGRIPIYNNDLATVDNILAKIIKYEQSSGEDVAWRKTVLMGAGGYDNRTKADKVLNQLHKNVIVPNSESWSDFRVYGTKYGNPTIEDNTNTKTGISPTIFADQWKESKPGVITWGTHGSATSAQYVLGSGNTTTIGNDYPGYVLCGSCSNATPSKANNLTYSILKNCGMGAIGGTNLTYYNPGISTFDGHGSDQGWMYTFVRFMVVDKLNSGETLTALREMDPRYGWYNRGPYVLYGDPTVGIEPDMVNIQKEMNIVKSHVSVTTTQKSVNFSVKTGEYALKIYSLSGSLVQEVHTNVNSSKIVWNKTNRMGHNVAKGIYVVKLLEKTAKGYIPTTQLKVSVK